MEKDIWLCQVLDVLFKLPCRKPMAFKSGTSLSKVYKAIGRFSEDIDVTVDHFSLVAGAPELEAISTEVSQDAEKLWVYYPSAVNSTDAYVRTSSRHRQRAGQHEPRNHL